MPRELLQLRTFNVGLVSNPDQEDIPNEAQVSGSYNIDCESQGKLRGIYKQDEIHPYGMDGVVQGWIQRNTGIWDLIYSTGSRTKIIKNFYEDASGEAINDSILTGMSGIGATAIISNNQEAHLGSGKDNPSAWVGYLTHGQFGGVAPTSLYITTANPAQPGTSHSIVVDDTTAAADAESAAFPKGYMYHYAFTFIYDGYQESPLNKSSVSTLFATQQVTADLASINLTLTIAGYSGINKRITGIRIYRRERPFFDSSVYTNYKDFLDAVSKLPYKFRPQRSKGFKKGNDFIENDLRYELGTLGDWGEFKTIKDIDINNEDWVTSELSSNATYELSDSNVNVGPTYFSNVGIEEVAISETATVYGLDYELGTVVGSYLFVANASHPDFPGEDAAHTVFRSKPSRFDTFDVYNDFLVLPTAPKAMKSHRGKLYIWDENTTYIIDPNNFIVVEEIKGRGCSSQQSVVETDYGLFWANDNGVYWSTLTEELLQPTKDNLSDPIRTQYQATMAATTRAPIVVYNSARNQLLVHTGDDIYAYNTVEKRWDFYSSYTLASIDEVCGAFIGKDGETYTVTDGAVYKDFADTSDRKQFVFISKEFTFDSPGQIKVIHGISVDYSGELTLYYSIDSGSTWVEFNSGILDSPIRIQTLMIKIAGTSTAVVDSVSIIFRRMIGIR